MRKTKSGGLGIFSMPEKMVVIGDLHADYEAFVFTLQKAGMISKTNHWSGRKTWLVIMGDLVDGKTRIGSWNKDSDKKIVDLIERLMVESFKKGGKVLVLLGNHEFMNMRGNFSYSGEGGVKEMGGEIGRMKYFNTSFRQFAKKCYLVLKIGDWLFCHAGIPPEIAVQYKIPILNKLSLKYFNKKMTVKEEDKFFDIISGEYGILTNREFGNERVTCGRLTVTLNTYGAKTMVVGHTVQTMINAICKNKLWRVDVGISRAFGDDYKKRTQFLLIYDTGRKIKIF